MPEYRRSYVPGGTYFFTVVSFRRLPILTAQQSRDLLHASWEDVRSRFPFTTVAICLLPDHLHCVWTLPDGDADYSTRWREIKRLFSKGISQSLEQKEPDSLSRQNRHEATVWQRRFWEHSIRDEEDLNRHIDYIHYNPVKHGLVEQVVDWEWSSFHRYVKLGYYVPKWGAAIENRFEGFWGE